MRIGSLIAMAFIWLVTLFINADDLSNTKESKVVIGSGSYLKIAGDSNINSFECAFNQQLILNTIALKYFQHEEYIRFESAGITLPNIEFNCGGKAINKDFHHLLKTDEYPEIKLNLKEIRFTAPDDATVHALVDINICDIQNTYNLPVSVQKDQFLKVEGKLPLNITDFNLEPPTKLLGLVKINPNIEIDFSFRLKVQESN